MSRGPNTKSQGKAEAGAAPTACSERSRRRWLRAALLGGLFCIGILGVALWIFTRSWFIIAQIQPELAAKLGGDLSIGSARYEGGGRFQFRDIALRVPGHPGLAGEVLHVDRAAVEVNPAALLRGQVDLEAIDLTGVFLRFCEDESNPGSFTFMDLNPEWETDDTEHVTSLPRLAVPYVTVEYGTNGPDGYLQRGRRWLAGAMKPEKDDRTYAFHLLEVDQGGSHLRDGIAVNGRWNLATNEHEAHVGGLVLDEAAYNMMPQAARMWWDRMDLQGRVSDARIHWSEGTPLTIDFQIEDVGLTLPISTEDLWARYHEGQVVGHSRRPRMGVRSGTIRFVGDAVALDLVGELRSEGEWDGAVRVPWRVTLNLRDLPPVDWDDRDAWMDVVLDTAPFEMTFEMRDFGVVPDGSGQLPPVDLPLRVAQVLERFLLTDWSLSAQVVVHRGAPQRDDSGDLIAQPILHRGSVTIRQASGAYEEFPYRLTDIDAELDFDTDGVRVRSLRGLAPNGAEVEIAGEISPPGRFPMVALTVRAEGVPVDDQLREALRFRDLAFFDWLMSIPAEQALRESGKLDAHPDAGGGDTQQPFELGGTVNLDLRIDRTRGPGEDTVVSGAIHINRLGVLYEHFPYPFTVTGGTLRLDHDGVRIVEDSEGRGVPIATIGGGRGFIAGATGREATETGWRAVPNFTIEVRGDTLNELIYAAIPLTTEERAANESLWPGGVYSEGASLLQHAGLEGRLDFVGAIAQKGDDIGYSFDVEFVGRADPGPDLAARLAEAGLIWPGDLTVDGVQAKVNVTNKGLELIDFTGHHEHGLLRAGGEINWSGPEAQTVLDLHLDDLVLGRYLIDLMPHERVEVVEELWERYQPSGLFNATLEFRSRGNAVQAPRLLIDPSQAQVVIDDQKITLRRHSGYLFVQGGEVRCEQFVIDFTRGEGDLVTADGRMRLDGAYGFSPDDEELTVEGVWLDGRLDSPIILEAMRQIGAESQIKDYQRLRPSGIFDAQFHYTSGRQGQPVTYGLVARPRRIEFDLGSTRLEAALDETSRVSFSEGLIKLEDVRGQLGDSRFALAGQVHTGPIVMVNLDHLAFDGALMDEQAQALLPETARNLLEQIEFADGSRTALERGVLSLVQREPDSAQWLTSFRGSVRTEGASFTAGINVSGFDGVFDLAVDEAADGPPRLGMNVSGDRLLVLDRRLTDLRAPDIVLSEDGRTLLIPEIRADCYGGVLWAQLEVGLSEGEAYEARIELVGGGVQGLVIGESGQRPRRTAEREGRAYGSVRLSGLHGDPGSRVGRGMLRAVGSHLENVPFVLQIMNLLQLTLPLRGEVDRASAEFFIEGDMAVFERLLLESTFGEVATLQLHGEGELNLRTLDVRTQFRSRGAMLLIRDVAGGVGDQLFAVEITGTLRNPRARIIPLPGLAATSGGRPGASPRPTATEAE